MGPTIFTDPGKQPPLDESLYSLRADESAFFREQTGIADQEELKRHITAVQRKAYQVIILLIIHFVSCLSRRTSRFFLTCVSGGSALSSEPLIARRLKS